MLGSFSGVKNKSSSASGLPLTKASAPPTRLLSRSRATVRSGGTTTSSGVGARSRIVPSTSSKTALEGRVTASINKSRSGLRLLIEYRWRGNAAERLELERLRLERLGLKRLGLTGQDFNFP